MRIVCWCLVGRGGAVWAYLLVLVLVSSEWSSSVLLSSHLPPFLLLLTYVLFFPPYFPPSYLSLSPTAPPGRLVSVLEGGYDVSPSNGLARCALAHCSALAES